ncbi:protein transport protein SEC9, partial [Tremellales sp. Uapishka_1]
MSFFKRNKTQSLIPPVQEPEYKAAPPDPYATAPAARNGGGDPYAKRSDPYASYAKTGQATPAAAAAGEAARNELFAGFQAPEKPQTERQYGYEGREMEQDFDEDDEIEGIRQGMRGVKQDSLASTRNALRLAREAEETARGTVAKLSDQSERIANSERYLDMANANNQRAEDKAGELKQLNRSIFRPVVVWNKDAKRQAEEDKINNRHLAERADRAKALSDVSETRKRLNNAANPLPYGADVRQPLPGEAKAKRDARARYQFEATASDDELEDELDDNLDETYEVTKRLKKLATAMGDEVSGQNNRLVRITDKTENLEFEVMKNTERLRRIGK